MHNIFFLVSQQQMCGRVCLNVFGYVSNPFCLFIFTVPSDSSCFFFVFNLDVLPFAFLLFLRLFKEQAKQAKGIPNPSTLPSPLSVQFSFISCFSIIIAPPMPVEVIARTTTLSQAYTHTRNHTGSPAYSSQNNNKKIHIWSQCVIK